jgi:hypothetical protein
MTVGKLTITTEDMLSNEAIGKFCQKLAWSIHQTVTKYFFRASKIQDILEINQSETRMACGGHQGSRWKEIQAKKSPCGWINEMKQYRRYFSEYGSVVQFLYS